MRWIICRYHLHNNMLVNLFSPEKIDAFTLVWQKTKTECMIAKRVWDYLNFVYEPIVLTEAQRFSMFWRTVQLFNGVQVR